jgi:hypothetical protein
MNRRAAARRRRKQRERGDTRQAPQPMTTTETRELAARLTFTTLDTADHKPQVFRG